MTGTIRRMDETVETVIEDPHWEEIGIEGLATAAGVAVLRALGHDPAAFEIVVLACDDARIAGLNASFRDKPEPTNVLSWPAADLAAGTDGTAPRVPRPGAPGRPEPLGDIAIARETCTREAAEAGKPLRDHVLHLLVHGCLHLLGYDHMRPRDAALMEGQERRILATMGVPDPY